MNFQEKFLTQVCYNCKNKFECETGFYNRRSICRKYTEFSELEIDCINSKLEEVLKRLNKVEDKNFRKNKLNGNK